MPLRINLRNAAGEAFTGARYSLLVGTRTFTGTVPTSGLLAHDIPQGATEATLRVWAPAANAQAQASYVWTLELGELEPVSTLSGVQGRLKGLGYYHGELDGEDTLTCRTAVRGFQRTQQGLTVDGGAGTNTQQRLTQAYGS
jgi:hypothetical protein